MVRWFLVTSIVLVVAIALFLKRDELFHLAFFAPNTGQIVSNGEVVTATPSSSSSAEPVAFTIEPVVTGLEVPWSLVFTSPTRFLVTERPGKVREVVGGSLNPNPIRVFDEISSDSEEGLMGMALDPDYKSTSHIFLCIAYEKDGKKFDKVVRVVDHDATLDQDTIIIDNIPAASFHAGCRLRFGPDGKLYISTGDATQKERAQELDYLGGKILRLNLDGSLPTDNPFPNSPVFSYGHRNSQGFDWHPVSGLLAETEHGPSGSDGPGGGDEINIISAGKNYGWPIVSHEKSQADMESPAFVFTPAIAPASGMFYRGDVFPQFKNVFFVGLLRGEGILLVHVDEEGKKAVSFERLAGVDVGRVRDIVEGPDGFIYFTTSNRDGRGQERKGDDMVYRIVPKNE